VSAGTFCRCSVCGAPAELSAASLDPRYPLGRCDRGHKGQPLVPVVTSPQRFYQLADQKRRRAAQRRHSQHLQPRGKPSRNCAACRELLGRRGAIHAIP
jgi:hypothetical protein